MEKEKEDIINNENEVKKDKTLCIKLFIIIISLGISILGIYFESGIFVECFGPVIMLIIMILELIKTK